MSDVTAIVVNWQRPDNVRRILAALYGQNEPLDILFIDHSPGGYPYDLACPWVRIPWDTGPFVFNLFAFYAETPWVMILNDDLMPEDADLVGDMRRIAELRYDGIVATHGKRLGGPPRYYSDMPDVDGWAHTVKRCCMFHRSMLEQMRMRFVGEGGPPLHDDLFLSLEIGRGRAVHWVDRGLRERTVELPAPHAISGRAEHYAERDRYIGWHLGKMELDSVLDRAESIPGQCTRRELAHLWRCAMRSPPGVPIVECGVYQGRSAAVLADVAYRKQVPLVLIDTFRYGTVMWGSCSAELVRANLQRVGVKVAPRIVEGNSLNVPPGVGQVGCLHIDTEHTAEHWNAEMDVWLPHMAPGGVLALHDYCDNTPEMAPAIERRIGADPQWKRLGLVRWMIAFQKEAADAG